MGFLLAHRNKIQRDFEEAEMIAARIASGYAIWIETLPRYSKFIDWLLVLLDY